MRLNKFFALAAAAAVTVASMTGCGENNTQAKNDSAELEKPVEDALDTVTDEAKSEAAEASNESEGVAGQTTLPAFTHGWTDSYTGAIYDYLISEIGGNYEPSDVTIPFEVFVAKDESDENDIKEYGIFWVMNYDLNEDGTILENVSGGSYAGVMHLKKDGDSYEVTSFDIVPDGSDFDENAKEIFGQEYETFSAKISDEDLREETRKEVIKKYVEENNLPITAYQDYGWDPVPLD